MSAIASRRVAGGRRLAAALLAVAAVSAAAPVGARAQRGGPPPSAADRQRLEAQVQPRLGEVVRRRLRLTDEQAARLSATNRQFQGQRQQLALQERELRGELRRQLSADSAADQNRVGALIDDAIRLQRKRLDLVEAEQRELAKFLSPVQRARYLTLQEQLRRRVDELRQGDAARRRRRVGGIGP